MIISTDKLHLSFTTEDYMTTEFVLIHLQKIRFIYTPLTGKEKDNNYREGYKIISSNGYEIDNLHLYSQNKNELCNLKMLNKALYTNRQEIIVLYGLLNYVFGDTLRISYLELAVDTNQPLVKRFNRHIKGIIDSSKGVAIGYFGMHTDSNFDYTTNHEETKYIYRGNKGFNKCKGQKMRIENKKEVLKVENKPYITDYLSNYIDINKPFYRFEIVFSSHSNFLISKHTYFKNDSGDVVSDYMYKKMDNKQGYRPFEVKKYHEINVKELLNNTNYAYTLFDFYSDRMIKKEKIIKMKNYVKQEIDMVNVETITETRVKKEKDIISPIAKETMLKGMFDKLVSLDILNEYESYNLISAFKAKDKTIGNIFDI